MLPRLLMRRCDLRGMACLDIGTMEGLTPTLMARGGASRVLAIDGLDYCKQKLAAVRHYYSVSFEYRTVGPIDSLTETLRVDGFDLINCSGLLYHVFSPLMILAGLRGLLKRNGVLAVSTNVILDRGFAAEFNAAGRLQEEPNTFWYLSTGLLDYFLRLLRLAPIECLYQPHEAMDTPWRMKTGMQSGYAAILCRAVDHELPTVGDAWMSQAAKHSCELEWIPDWDRADSQPISGISLRRSRSGLSFLRSRKVRNEQVRPVDITTAIEQQQPVSKSDTQSDSYTLTLSDSA